MHPVQNIATSKTFLQKSSITMEWKNCLKKDKHLKND